MSQPKVEIPLDIKDDTDGVSFSIPLREVSFWMVEYQRTWCHFSYLDNAIF